jgi:hypothetical protein
MKLLNRIIAINHLKYICAVTYTLLTPYFTDAQNRPFQIETGLRIGLFSGPIVSILYSPASWVSFGLHSDVVKGLNKYIIEVENTTIGLINFNIKNKNKEFKYHFFQFGSGISIGRPYMELHSDYTSSAFYFGFGTKRKRINTAFFYVYKPKVESYYKDIIFEITYSILKPKPIKKNEKNAE